MREKFAYFVYEMSVQTCLQKSKNTQKFRVFLNTKFVTKHEI